MAPPTADSPVGRRVEYVVELIKDLDLHSPLYVFEMQLRAAQEAGRKTTRYKAAKYILDDDRFITSMTTIMTLDIAAPNIESLFFSNSGALLDSVVTPILGKELDAEMENLVRVLDEITPEKLLAMNYGQMRKEAKETAPRTWKMVELLVGKEDNRANRRKRQKRAGDGDAAEGGGGEGIDSDSENEDTEWEDVGGDGKAKWKRKKKQHPQKPKVRKDVDLMILGTVAVMSYTRTNRANKFQLVNGYYLNAANCPKRLRAVMARFGFCMTYESTIRVVRHISLCVKDIYMEMVQNELFIEIWDNLNQMYRVKSRTITYQEHLSNETQPYLLFVSDRTESSDWRKEPLTNENIRRERALDMEIADLEPNFDLLRHASFVHGCNILMESSKPLAALMAKDSLPSHVRIHQIPVRPAVAFPLPTLRLNEGRIDETIKVIQEIGKEIRMEGPVYEEKDMIQLTGGDFATVRNTNKAAFQRADATTVAESLSFVEPTIEMFHFTMFVLTMILYTHFGRSDGKDYASIAKFKELLGFEKIGLNCKDFRTLEFFLLDMFKAHFLAAVLTLAVQADMAGLEKWFEEHSWDQLLKYLCSSVFDPLTMQRRKFKDSGQVRFKPAGPKTKTANPEDTSAMKDEGIIRDIAMDNALLFLRDMMVYRELTDACKTGDSGRLVECIKYFAVCFQVTRQFNYAAKSIHLIACLEHIWDDKARRVWMNTVLMNP
ncbi:hypothetical protein BJ508DRAFT_331407 [Ascobolus immersus RN42]|uniref:DUF6589 domain-containing protein n=1 Tax=Ascobolus immersus RN42 TaxID=1160509 RepID=A0A3N4I2N3_ASCIM|nr:hypothetical protein BJ508DRAFT_331407 [Ascobolus immersus RN42]